MTRPTKGRARAESYITGEKGINRVRLYPNARDGKLYLEFRDGSKRTALALGHSDFDLGKQKAEELALKLRQHEAPTSGVLTLRALFDKYECEATARKSLSKQQHDRRARALFEECWGRNAKVIDLDRRDWDRFIDRRRDGSLRHAGDARKQQGVRDRVVEYDLRFLLAVCNWALTVREKGQPLLERNPFAGFPVPKEENPSRPIVTAEELAALERAATVEGPEVRLYLLLVKETGHRCTAVGRLRWTDVDLAAGKLRWRAEHDKMGREHIVLLSEPAAAGLAIAEQQRKASGRIGDGWLFPSPTDDTAPVRRDLLRDWWQKLEKRSGIERVRGRGWHSLRRLFATDLKDTPLADLCYMGGWRDPNTVLKCYMRPDDGTMRKALAGRTALRAAGA
jgi:integrase